MTKAVKLSNQQQAETGMSLASAGFRRNGDKEITGEREINRSKRCDPAGN